jgi:hypothetical protein
MSDERDTMPNPFWVGLDLGQARDWTALAISEQVGTHPNRYQTRYLERWQPHRYSDVVAKLAGIIAKLRTPVHAWDGWHYQAERSPVTLVVDRTGVGRPIGDAFLDAQLDCHLELVTITGGDSVTRDGNTVRVPKRDLAGGVAVLLQTERLKIAEELTFAEILRAELKNFRVRISAAGHDSYGAGDDWRESAHDDLVLAQALALWAAEQHNGGEFQDLPTETVAALSAWFDGGPM